MKRKMLLFVVVLCMVAISALPALAERPEPFTPNPGSPNSPQSGNCVAGGSSAIIANGQIVSETQAKLGIRNEVVLAECRPV